MQIATPVPSPAIGHKTLDPKWPTTEWLNPLSGGAQRKVPSILIPDNSKLDFVYDLTRKSARRVQRISRLPRLPRLPMV